MTNMPSAGLARNSIYFQLSTLSLFLTNHILKKIDQVKLKGSIENLFAVHLL